MCATPGIFSAADVSMLVRRARGCGHVRNRACSVLVDGEPLYSCHTLAMEAAGRKILTIEGVGTPDHLHPLQRIGHTHVAADCGFCTAGWVARAVS